MSFNWSFFDANGGDKYFIIRYTDGYIYVGTSSDPRIVRSNDGINWSDFFPGSGTSDRMDAIIASNGNLITVGRNTGNKPTCDIWSGSSWSSSQIDTNTSIAFWVFEYNNVLYSGTSKLGAVIKKSTNFGTSWVGEYTFSSGDFAYCRCGIHFDGYFYLGGQPNMVKRRPDTGGSWVTYNSGLSHNAWKFGICQDTLFIGAQTGQIYKLSGSTWSQVTNPGLTIVRGFLTLGNDLYVVGEKASGDRIYKSSDLGVTWEGMGVTDRNLLSVYYDSDLGIYLVGSASQIGTATPPTPTPPIDTIVTNESNKNTITFNPGPKNDYFNSLNNWDTYTQNSLGTVEINSGKLKITCPDADESIRAVYKQILPDTDFIVITDLNTYSENNSSYPIRFYFGIDDNFDNPWPTYYASNYITIRPINNIYGVPAIRVYYSIGGVTSNTDVVNPATMPTKLMIIKGGTYLNTYYYEGGSWTLLDSKDFGIYANKLKIQYYQVEDNTEYGGYVEIDNFCIIPYDHYFPNDTFNDIDRWYERAGVNYTISLVSGAVRLDGEDSIGAYAQLTNEYSIPQGDLIVDIDLVNYVADDPGTDNALQAIFRIGDMDDGNTAYLTYANKAAGHRAWLVTKINDGSPTIGSEVVLASQPSKLRIERSDTTIYVYVYIGSWILIDSEDFGSYSIVLSNITLEISSSNNRGGYVDFDNLTCDVGINSYNLYWKKNKCPNCYFYDLNDWDITKLDGTEESEIQNDKLHIDIPNSTDAEVMLTYNHQLPDGDFETIISFFNYTSDSSDGIRLYLRIRDSVNENNCGVFYRATSSGDGYLTRGFFKENNVTTNTDIDYPTILPTKLRLRKIGTTFYSDYYVGDWTNLGSQDLGFFGDNVKNIDIYIIDESLSGGSLDIDDLIILPSVRDDYDGVTNDIIDLEYDQTSFDGNAIYCYELTAQGSESGPSEEIYGLTVPETPSGIDTTAGIEQITISWDDSTGGADQYNLYWSDEWLYDEFFDDDSSLDNWTITKNHGTETVEVIGGRLRLTNNGNNGSGSNAYYTGYDIPSSGDFEIVVDVWHSDWEKSVFAIRSSDLSTRVFQIVSSSYPGGGNYATTYTVTGSPSDDGAGTQYSPLGYPSKFKFVRIGTVIYLYMYLNSSWQLRHSADFGAYAYEFTTVHLGDQEESSGVDYIEFDNLIYTADVSEIGTKIEDVESPYIHTPLNPGIRYYYALTAENISGESEATEPIYDIPIPEAPTILDTTADVDAITIYWDDSTVDIDYYNIYWDTTSGVTIETGNIIEGVVSPYTHESLTGGDTYYYVVTAIVGEAESSESNEVSDTALIGTPNPPTGISVTPGEELNTITFTADPFADKTHVYWDTISGVSIFTGTKIEDITSPYNHTGLHPEPRFYYILTSENEYGEGDPSAEYNSSPIPEPPVVIDTTSEIESIIISWEDSTGADSYNIYWKISPGVTKLDNKITGAISPYLHSSLTPGQEYFYAITSEDEDGESSLSEEFSDIADIGIPDNISAISSGDREITISWNPVSGATTYNIYWLKISGVTIDLGNKISGVSSPYVHDSNLDPDDTYYYVVTAENALIESIESEEVHAVATDIPEAPTNLIATSVEGGISLSWDTLTHIDSYNLYWDTTSGVTIETGTLIENVSPPYLHETPSFLDEYYYVVTAVNDIYESDESNEDSALPTPEGFHAPEQSRTVDGFSYDGHSDILNTIMKLFTYNEDLLLFPNQSFSLTMDSTHEVTIGMGVCIKDNTIVHVQQTYTLDFNNNDYYIDSTGDMDGEGYYYIVLKYNKTPITPSSKLSYHIIRNTSLFNIEDYIFLGVANVIYSDGYMISEVLTSDPSSNLDRPTLADEDWLLIDAGEL